MWLKEHEKKKEPEATSVASRRRYPCSNNKSEWKLDSSAIARGNSTATRNIQAPKERAGRQDGQRTREAFYRASPLVELSGTLIALTAFCAPRDFWRTGERTEQKELEK